jgi:hypothetical protein
MKAITPMGPMALIETWERAATRMGLDSNHFVDLLDDHGDWSLIIKCSALIETALNVSLRKGLSEPIAHFVERASLEKKRGLAFKLGLLSDSQNKEIRALARIRNLIVHNAAGFKFSLAEHLKSTDQKNRFLQAYGLVWTPGTSKADRKRALENPLMTMRISAIDSALQLVSLADPSVLGI